MKRTRPIRRRQGWQVDWEYGYVVRASKVRSGCNTRQWMCEPGPGFKCVGLTSDLQEARWHEWEDREGAESVAHWQLGHVKFARRDKLTGKVEELYE